MFIRSIKKIQENMRFCVKTVNFGTVLHDGSWCPDGRQRYENRYAHSGQSEAVDKEKGNFAFRRFYDRTDDAEGSCIAGSGYSS